MIMRMTSGRDGSGPGDAAGNGVLLAGAGVRDRLLLWTTDLSNYLACPHLTSLSLAAAMNAGPEAPKYEDPGTEALKKKGDEHEQRVLARFRDEGLRIACVSRPPEPEEGGPEKGTAEHYAAAAAATIDAMRAGPDIIFQGTLFDGTWLGRTDFLRRVERPSPVLGDWSYEVIDAKLAREAKGGHVLQISLYSDLLAKAQCVAPEHMHLVLGGPEPREESYRVNDYAAYYRLVRRRFDAHIEAQGEAIVAALAGAGVAVPAVDVEAVPAPGASTTNGASLRRTPGAAVTTYPEPCDHCVVCDWKSTCVKRWHEDDHLSLVAGIGRRQRAALTEREPPFDTLAALGGAALPLDPPLDGSSPTSTERIREQARIQLAGRLAGEPRHELLEPVVQGEGLAALPVPSPGDLFLDFESDRFHEYIGLEYLLGYNDVDGTYTAIWALDRAQETAAFERFIDFVMERLERHPDLHIYHYAAYEETALKRLAGRHSTRVDELDHILRQNILVDLYRVVRQGLRASVESYSIKQLEPFYGYGRDVDLRAASGALAQFEVMLELGRDDPHKQEILDRIEGYNKDDCLSTLKLRGWLEELRGELEAQTGAPVPRPAPPAESDEDEELSPLAARVAELVERLTTDIPADAVVEGAAPLTPEQEARRLLAHLLDFHRREDKAMWWEYFARCDMNEAELIDDRSCLGGLEYVGVVDTVARSLVHRYRFPEQEHDLREGDSPHIAERGELAGEIVALDDLRRTIDIKRGKAYEMPERMGLVPLENVSPDILRDSLLRLAEVVLEDGLEGSDRTRLAADLLLRRAPRVGNADGKARGNTGGDAVGDAAGAEERPGAPLDRAADRTPLQRPDEDELTAARRVVRALDCSVLAIQGPPGSGKTYTGARMICDLLDDKKRVGVTATSHKVIGNLLKEVCKVARERGLEFRGLQKADEHQWCEDDLMERIGSAPDVAAALAEARKAGTPALAAGTSWLWAREDMADSVEVLFVDEAGQFSLANALAVAQAAGSLVLLGDPQQLEQPIKGVHPDGAGVSALDHLLDGAATIAPEQGLFLAHTWRLHPDLCAFTSELFYDGKLEPQQTLNRQRISGPEPFDGTGLRFVPVEHSGNRNHSPEEVEVVKGLVDELLAADATWTDMDGETHPIELDDILIVAPYNAQVTELKEALGPGARVGTVDKFQGQEAPIVIYSMATSTPAEAPRGMEFLYSANRLNVAMSRPRCVVVIVASPAIMAPECKTPRQMALANGYARMAELVW